MFAFAESLKIQEIKWITPYANFRLLSVMVSVQIFNNMLQPCTMSSNNIWSQLGRLFKAEYISLSVRR